MAMMALDSSIQFGTPHANDNVAPRGAPDRPGRGRRPSRDRHAAAVDRPSRAGLDRGVDRVLVQARRSFDLAGPVDPGASGSRLFPKWAILLAIVLLWPFAIFLPLLFVISWMRNGSH
jgi:hypothetical protein